MQPVLRDLLYSLQQDESALSEDSEPAAAAPQRYYPAAAAYAARQMMPAKRNSELLNSLLGLPKNILRSGRK